MNHGRGRLGERSLFLKTIIMKNLLSKFSRFTAMLLLFAITSCSNESEEPTIPDNMDQTDGMDSDDDTTDQPNTNDQDNDGIPDEEDIDIDGDGLIEISSLNALDNIRNDLSASGREFKSEKNSFIGFELTKDLDFNNPDDYDDPALLETYTTGKGWQPIGTDSEGNSIPFEVTFEGNGFTISNLYIDNVEDFNNYGLFGKTGVNSVLRNLGLNNASITTESFNVGGLVGQAEGVLENCHVNGEISGRNSVGLLVGSCNAISISKCSSLGEVNGIDISVSDSFGVGGLIGTLFLGNSSANPTTLVANITDCFSQANVNGNRSAGGFIGSIIVDAVQGTVSVSLLNSYATGRVTGSSVGGFIAASSMEVEIEACYWDIETSSVDLSDEEWQGEGLTTTELQTPIDTSGIYATWDSLVWDFGNSNQYPVLLNMPNGVENQR